MSRITLPALLTAIAIAIAGGVASETAPTGASFPGANGMIAFMCQPDTNPDICVMNPDGTGMTNLTNHPSADLSPVWSPDGSQIAFTSDRDSDWDLGVSNVEVYVMNADGSGLTNLTGSPGHDGSPAWSPDGSQIAFSSDRAGTGDIYVMNADGSGVTRLTNDPADEAWLDWSPDGTQIAFTREWQGSQEVYVMNADGSGQANLTNNEPAFDLKPSWSPDGSRIVFETDRDGNDNYEVYVMNADGSGVSSLTASPGNDGSPVWSPDGSQVAFVSYRDGDSDIYVMNADGSSQTNITNNSTFSGEPDWQPLVSAAPTTIMPVATEPPGTPVPPTDNPAVSPTATLVAESGDGDSDGGVITPLVIGLVVAGIVVVLGGAAWYTARRRPT